MGVPEVYKLLVDSIETSKTTDLDNPFSFSLDLNGFIHRCCGCIFGYAENDLENKPISKEKIRSIREKLLTGGFDELKFKLFAEMKVAIEKLILDVIRPTTILIITIDGISPPAKGNQQRIRRAKAGYDRLNYYEDETGKKISDIRINQMLYNGENFQRYWVNSDSLFDTSFITAGTPFMTEVSKCIKEWIDERKSRLPFFTYFSGVEIRGEGEHKIFKLLNNAIDLIGDMRIQEYPHDQQLEKKKEIIAKLKKQKHIIYGNDADLLFLSMIRDYNFLWLKEGYNMFNPEEAVIVNIVRDYAINKMKGKIKKPTAEQRKRMTIDFCLITFFIGDDFVPSMFTINNNIKITIDRFMDVYATLHEENKFNSITDNDNNIYTRAFYDFIVRIVPVEKELYERKALIDKIEREVRIDNEELIAEVNKYRTENKKKVLGHRYADGYVPCDHLNKSYEEFTEFWKNVFIRPSIMSSTNVTHQNLRKTDSLCKVDEDTLNKENDQVCQDYLTGLQWNLKYYVGKRVNNWIYKKSFPPTILALRDFIHSNKWVNTDVIFSQAVDIDLSVKQMISLTINPHFSMGVLLSVFETEKAYRKFIGNSPYLSTIHPMKFASYFQAKYTSQSYMSLPLLPQFYLSMINKQFNQIDIYNHNLPGNGILDCNRNFKAIDEALEMMSTISFNVSSTQIIPNRDQLKRDEKYQNERGFISAGGGGRGRGRGREQSGRTESGRMYRTREGISTRVNPKRQIQRSGGTEL